MGLVVTGALAGIVSHVSEAEYGEEELNARLSDLDWTGQRALEHEQVLSWFVDRVPVIPLRPFSLHADENRVLARVEALAPSVSPMLESLVGRREWGVRVRGSTLVAEQLHKRSTRLVQLAEEIAAASPGRRYLLEKKRDSALAEELRELSTRVAREAYRTLAARAEQAKLLPLVVPADSTGTNLLLQAAFLVQEAAYSLFEQELAALIDRYRPQGFEFEFTGPWPPYHFVEL